MSLPLLNGSTKVQQILLFPFVLCYKIFSLVFTLKTVNYTKTPIMLLCFINMIYYSMENNSLLSLKSIYFFVYLHS